jgi:CheY-like chemotaxis protein
MDTRHKILLLDDDPDLLEMYRELLAQLPSKPEIHTAISGPRGMAMLEAHAFRLLICDLPPSAARVAWRCSKPTRSGCSSAI